MITVILKYGIYYLMPSLSLFLSVSSVLLILSLKPKLQHKVVNFFSNNSKANPLLNSNTVLKISLILFSVLTLQAVVSSLT